MTSMPYRITLTVEMCAPFITQSSEPGAFGLDMVVARDDDGTPIIPGTLLTGKLMDAWEQFEETPLIERWLGREGSNFEPSSGRLCDADLRFKSGTPEAIRTPYSRVAIDENTEAGKQGALFFIEQPWAAFETIKFTGTWSAIGSEEEIRNLCGAIKGGLIWMAQLGAARSIGFGQVHSVEVTSCPAPLANNQLSGKTGSRLCFALSFTEPLCLPQTATDNLFESSDIIPGNALKAAFALTWGAQEGKWNKPVKNDFSERHKALAEAFDNIGFSHAFPAGNGDAPSDQRPLPLPQSLVLAGNEFFDVALLDKPHLISNQAPAFQVDWKGEHYHKAGKQQAWGETRSALRVRTAIEKDSRISKEAELFAYETVSPKKHTRWLGWVDFSAIDGEGQRKAAMQSFVTLTQGGLHYIGKTKAVGTLEVMNEQKNVSPIEAKDGMWIVMLNTPALLTPISCFNETSGRKELHKVYADYWKEVSGGTLELSHYFARQRLAGGKYAHGRRQRGKQYKPWLLTEAGSVFVLRTSKNGASEKIGEWLRSGLPLSKAVKTEYMDDRECKDVWRYIPYLPQNGYGEISVNIEPPFPRLNKGDKRLTTVDELTVEEQTA